MKTIFLITIITLAFASGAYSQGACSAANNIQSPVVQKPTQAAIASVTCSAMVIQWQGSSGPTYLVNAIQKDAAGNKTIKTIAASDIVQNGVNYTASIPVAAGAKISWSIQGIKVVDNRTFYSYPLHGKEYTIPDCSQPVVAKANANAASSKSAVVSTEKLQVKMYPNPVQSRLNVAWNGTTSKSSISIFDVYGRKVFNQQTAQNNLQINVQQLAPGIYFLRVEAANGKLLFNGKFIKD